MGRDEADPRSRCRPTGSRPCTGGRSSTGERPGADLMIGGRMKALIVHLTRRHRTARRGRGSAPRSPLSHTRAEAKTRWSGCRHRPSRSPRNRRRLVVARFSATTHRNRLAPGPSKRPTSGSDSSGAHTCAASRRSPSPPRRWVTIASSYLGMVTMTSPTDTTNLAVALALAARGWPVLPLCWPTDDGSCGCGQGHEQARRREGARSAGWFRTGSRTRRPTPRRSSAGGASARTPTSASTWCALA